MIGKGLAEIFGTMMLVLSLTPSRIGIIALVMSKAGPASCRASDSSATANKNAATNNPQSATRFITPPENPWVRFASSAQWLAQDLLEVRRAWSWMRAIASGDH